MTNFLQLTELEAACLNTMAREGRDCTGATNADEMIEDNMTIASLEDFGIDPKVVRGVLTSLIKKGLCAYDRGDFDKPPVWYLTEDGINTYWGVA